MKQKTVEIYTNTSSLSNFYFIHITCGDKVRALQTELMKSTISRLMHFSLIFYTVKLNFCLKGEAKIGSNKTSTSAHEWTEVDRFALLTSDKNGPWPISFPLCT